MQQDTNSHRGSSADREAYCLHMDCQGNSLSDFFETNGRSILKRVDNNHKLRSFTEKEIELITNGYDTSLGNGSFGDVYKGTLDGQRPVAVKRYKNGTKKEEFAKEVIVHSQINHKNVVRLLGCCAEENALMIVMEFICNGNLYNILHCSNSSGPVPFPLDKRLDIAIQSAEALSCMHSMYSPVLHGDIKPANILLDEKYMPKISDFGIARLLSTDEAQHTRTIIGCIGYVDPLFCQSGILTPKSDVYSFGVVLLEMITRKKAAGGNTNLTQCFTEAVGRGKKLRELFDVEIANDKKNMKLLEHIAKLAAKCLRMDDKMRPEMVEVADRLRMIRKALPQHKCESSTGSNAPFPRSADEEKMVPLISLQELRKITRSFSNDAFKGEGEHGKKGVNGAQPGAIFSWEQRVKIALSAANGLAFLHQKADPPVIHGRISSRNIFLFEEDVAKIGDVGFSKRPLTYREQLAFDSPYAIIRSPFDAPEYVLTKDASTKSDVYSFGVVLLELLTGREAVDRTMRRGQQGDLVSWASIRLENPVGQWVDPRLEGNYPPMAVAKMAQLALSCCVYRANNRPNMSAVIKNLELTSRGDPR